MNRVWRLFALSLLLVAALPAFPQAQAINGSIRGQVTDQTGSPMANAEVSIRNVATGFHRESQTDSDGYYLFPNLPLVSTR